MNTRLLIGGGIVGGVILLLALIWFAFHPRHPSDRVASVIPQEATKPVVAVIGTSLTASASWPEVLEKSLSDCLGRRVQVENLAANIATSELGLVRIDGLVAVKPSVIVIEFAINDADTRIGVSLPESRRRHETILGAIRARLPDTAIYLMTTNHATGRSGRRRPLLPVYYGLYRDLAEQFDTGLADMTPRWRKVESTALPDGLHPMDETGNTIIVPVLKTLIGGTLGGSGPSCAAE